MVPAHLIQRSHDYLIMLISLSTPAHPVLPSAPGKYIILRHTKSYNISITHQSEFELLDVAEIHQSQQTGEDPDCFQIAKDLFNEPYSQVIYSLIFLATVRFVNVLTYLVNLSDQDSEYS